MKVGDALDPATEVGPLVAERQRDRVENYIRIGQEEGAKVAVGGGRPDGHRHGLVRRAHRLRGRRQLACASPRRRSSDRCCRSSPTTTTPTRCGSPTTPTTGCAAAVFTGDNDRGLDVARQVRTGTYMVNSNIPIDFSSPFGGYKASGVGREFGEDGLELFLEKKTINLPAGYSPAV